MDPRWSDAGLYNFVQFYNSKYPPTDIDFIDEGELQNPNFIVLPAKMVFRYRWTKYNGEEIPITATLLEVNHKKYIHKINENEFFPPHFNGRLFTSLSSSSLFIKPCELNGFLNWAVWNEGTQSYILMSEARNLTFVNKYAYNLKDYKNPLTRKLTKKKLLELEDRATATSEEFIPIKRNQMVGNNSKKRGRKPKLSSHSGSSGSVLLKSVPVEGLFSTWNHVHSLYLYAKYLSVVFSINIKSAQEWNFVKNAFVDFEWAITESTDFEYLFVYYLLKLMASSQGNETFPHLRFKSHKNQMKKAMENAQMPNQLSNCLVHIIHEIAPLLVDESPVHNCYIITKQVKITGAGFQIMTNDQITDTTSNLVLLEYSNAIRQNAFEVREHIMANVPEFIKTFYNSMFTMTKIV